MLHLKEFAESTSATPQRKSMPNKKQVENSAGGFVFKVDTLQRVRRFVILGTESGTYYSTQQQLTRDNSKFMIDTFTNKDTQVALDALNEVIKLNVENRAPKVDTSIFCLALAMRYGNDTVKKQAWEAVEKVCRIPTHLFALVEFNKLLNDNGNKPQFGRLPRRVIAKFYNNKKPSDLAYTVTKYKNRNNWTHRDILRLAHVKAEDELHNLVLKFVVKGLDQVTPDADVVEISAEDPMDVNNTESQKTELLNFLQAVKTAGDESTDEDTVVKLIEKYKLAREHLNSKSLNSPLVWKTLLKTMPTTALLRNLGKMSKLGILQDESPELSLVIENITSVEKLRKARIHPFSVLLCLNTYNKGFGFRGSGKWEVNEKVSQALDTAFYSSFKFVEPTNKRFFVGLDVSGSMTQTIQGSDISCNVAGAALLMTLLKTEPSCQVAAFTSTLTPLDFKPEHTLQQIVDKTQYMNFGRTDCAQPMIYAKKNNLEVDVFVVITDNETWYGKIHPLEALRQYRNSKPSRSQAKLVVIGMTATKFSIADPEDAGSLDVVGFDSAAPQIISEFVNGLI